MKRGMLTVHSTRFFPQILTYGINSNENNLRFSRNMKESIRNFLVAQHVTKNSRGKNIHYGQEGPLSDHCGQLVKGCQGD